MAIDKLVRDAKRGETHLFDYIICIHVQRDFPFADNNKKSWLGIIVLEG
jgi:hypothetical protein